MDHHARRSVLTMPIDFVHVKKDGGGLVCTACEDMAHVEAIVRGAADEGAATPGEDE